MDSKDVGQYLEENAIEQAIGGNQYDAMKSNDMYNDTQLNQKIMTPEWESNKIFIMKPQMIEEIVWMPVYLPDGSIKKFNGQTVVELKKVKRFDGWAKEEITFAAGNLFKSDLATAISGEGEMVVVNKLMNLYFYVVELSATTGEDYSYDLYKFYNLIGSVLNTSKSKYGKTLEMVKTNITKGEMTNTVRQMLLQDQKRKGIFGGLRQRLNF